MPSALLYLVMAGLGSSPATIELGDPTQVHYLHEALWLLRDPTGSLSIEQVASKDAGAFQRWTGRRPNFGYTHDTIWARFDVENVSNVPATWVLEAGREWLEQVDLYRVMPDGFSRQRSGAVVPLAERPVREERPAFEIALGPQEHATLYLRLKSNGPVALSGELTSRQTFEQGAVRAFLAFGGFYAVLLVMGAFHLLLGLTLREGGFLWLSSFLLVYCGAEMSAHGHVARFFPALAGTAEIRLTSFLFAAVCLTLVEFTRFMLATREWSPARDIVLRRVALVSAAACCVAAFAPRFHVLTFVGLAVLVVALLWVAIARWREGFRPARWFAVALATFLGPAMVALAAILGLAPATTFTENANHVGLVVMTCLLSLGLAARIKDNRRAVEVVSTVGFTPEFSAPMTTRSSGDGLGAAVTARRTPYESTLGLAPSSQPPPLASGGVDIPRLQPGEALAGRFTIVRFIARGGMGAVYEANDAMLRSRVALKVIRGRIATDATAMERFRREVLLARRVSHPNVCRVYELYEAVTPGGVPIHCLSMELLEGETLSQFISRKGRLTTDEALPLVRQLCAGLAAAHAEGVIHRDFKSSNVILVSRSNPGGEATRAVITDFGIAHDAVQLTSGEAADGPLTGGATILGTPEYMAPEQITGGAVTEATDIYELGVVLYEMVTGKFPFTGSTPLATAAKRLNEAPPDPEAATPGLDSRWSATVLRCLEREPERRFKSALDIPAALRPLESQRPTP